MGVQNTGSSLDGLQKTMQQALESALSERITSESPHQITGNAYQSVRFGDDVRGGFRASRPNLFAGFPIEGRSVCDLGANLGEIARDLRRSGAAFVDAYEYDQFFTQLARYISAYNGITDVNHIQADVSQTGFMRRKYDVCVGLSAYSFMGKAIDYICEQTNELMIIETHEVGKDWYARYVAPISRHFAHWCCFGVVAHGAQMEDKRRLWLAFSKHDMQGIYLQRADAIAPGEGAVEIDLSKSKLGFLDQVKAVLRPGEDPLSEASLRLCADRLEQAEQKLRSGGHVGLSMSGEPYWLSLLLGLAEFERDGDVDADGTYLRWMRRGIEAGKIDPGLRPLLSDPAELAAKVRGRLSALNNALRERNVRSMGIPIIYNAVPDHPDLKDWSGLKTLRLSGSGADIRTPAVDGHHRIFVMELLGIETCQMMMVWDPGLLNTTGESVAGIPDYADRMYQYLGGALQRQ